MSVFEIALILFDSPICHWRTFLHFKVYGQCAPKRSSSAPPVVIFQTASEKVVKRSKKKAKTRAKANDDLLLLAEAKQLALQENWQRIADAYREQRDIEIRKQLIARTPQRRASLSAGSLEKLNQCLDYNSTDVFLMFLKKVYRYVDDDRIEIWCSDDQLNEERFQKLYRTAIRCQRVFFIDVHMCGKLLFVPYKLPYKTDVLRRKVTFLCGLPSATVSLQHADGGGVIVQKTITEDLVKVGDTLLAVVTDA